MTNTAEIVASVETVKADVGDARACAGDALERAGELTEQAAAHGWLGVAASMQGARDALETALASLGAADNSADETLTALGVITDQTSRPEVAEHLGQALNHLDQIGSAVDAASSAVEDARRACEQAGSPEEPMRMLQGVVDAIDAALRGLDGVRTTTESERQQAATWGN